MEKLCLVVKILKFLYFQLSRVCQICDAMISMRQSAFSNISFESQLINPPNLVNW